MYCILYIYIYVTATVFLSDTLIRNLTHLSFPTPQFIFQSRCNYNVWCSPFIDTLFYLLLAYAIYLFSIFSEVFNYFKICFVVGKDEKPCTVSLVFDIEDNNPSSDFGSVKVH